MRAYLQIAAHWEDASTLRNTRSVDELVELARDPHANVVAFTSEAAPVGQAASRPIGEAASRRRPPQTIGFACAATLVLALLGSLAWYWRHYQLNVYTTDIGEQRSITLDDGSTVDLNARSRIRVAFHEHQREIELLEGQALFKVVQQPARPFVVHAGNTDVRAVGTRFDVYRKNMGTVVTVVEGARWQWCDFRCTNRAPPREGAPLPPPDRL